jgi:transposase
MDQLHKRFSVEQVKLLLQRYTEGEFSRAEIEEVLGIGKTRFFGLLKAYRDEPKAFSIEYERRTPRRLSEEAEQQIAQELKREKELVDDPQLPITSYNYTALRDRLQKKKIRVSVPTIIQRAKQLECYKPQRKHKIHDRVVVTSAIGALIQHDASSHLWSPYASEKWTLITSIDDFSRLLLFADFVSEEGSWAHIQAAQRLMQAFGLPLCYDFLSKSCRQFTRLSFCGRAGQCLAEECLGNRGYYYSMAPGHGGFEGQCDLCPLTPGQRQSGKTLPLVTGPHR